MQLAFPAIVRPRCCEPRSGDDVLLEDVVREFAETHERGVVEICGPRGAGKSKALEYLKSSLADLPDVRYLDDAWRAEVASLSAVCVVVCVATEPLAKIVDLRLQLAPWSDDELIEYLLAAHPEACASVMQRVLAAEDRGILHGAPELWALVMEQMAADPRIDRVKTALRAIVAPFLRDPYVRALAGDCAWTTELACSDLAERFTTELDFADGASFLRRALRWPQIRRMLAAERLYEALHEGRSHFMVNRPFPRPLLEEIAALILAREESDPERCAAIDHVRSLADARHQKWQGMAVSLLHACGKAWRPAPGERPRLSHAYLNGIAWPGVDMKLADLREADLSLADLLGVNLREAMLKKAQFAGACLREASLQCVWSQKANFSQADLSKADATGGDFRGADFSHANLQQAMFSRAQFDAANLTSADFSRADLSGADFAKAIIDNANFSSASLVSAKLSGLALGKACWHGASFYRANLRGCDLEGIAIDHADFRSADLRKSHLTASQMPQANFQDADLRDTGLADIHWEGADLRNADLTGSTFHMGTTRSGMLITPYASEGTRTGFYTDEFAEQHFKRPEDVRKANLRGADLRGARVLDVDFYLVDLRDAKYTPDQRDHFRRCRAILS